MVYPEGIWYGQVRAEDVPEIIENHLLGGKIVKRLALKELRSSDGSSTNERSDVESLRIQE